MRDRFSPGLLAGPPEREREEDDGERRRPEGESAPGEGGAAERGEEAGDHRRALRQSS